MLTLTVKEPASWPANGQVDWQGVDELLKTAQYEQVAELLRQAKVENGQGDDATLAGMLAATYQICLALAATQSEIDWYRRNYKAESSPALSTEPPTSLTMPLGIPVEVPAAAFTKRAQRGDSCRLGVRCLGPFRVYQNQQLVEKWNGYKCKLLFKYLVIHRKQPVHREVLMDLFWPEADPTAARKNLHQAIFNLRQTFQASCQNFTHILFEDSCYYLNPELDVDLDSEAFLQHYQKGQQLERQGFLLQATKEYERADSLYKGQFLAEDLYEDWTIIQRENLKHAYLDILDRLSQFYFDQKQLTLCAIFCQKMLALDNCHEEAHRRLMRCYQSQGQRHLALRQYRLCAAAMERELAVSPMPATVELYRQIQGNHT